MGKKVFVTGCFDLLHSGHVKFLKEAAKYGELYVSVGSDKTIENLKNRKPVYSEKERTYILNSIKYVKKAVIGSGKGKLDFIEELKKINPDIFIVNKDGDSKEKRELCKKQGIEYIVLERIPEKGLEKRSTSQLINKNIPYRIDLAGGWLDQPFVSKYYPGPVITISINPQKEFNNKSGMATSTRNKAIELWTNKIPDNSEKTAKVLFCYENPPGKKEIAGSQDALGIVLPGLNCLYYDGKYWPEKIEKINEEDILSWIKNHLYLIPLKPREKNYDVLSKTKINKENAKKLAKAAENCFKSILEKDLRKFGKYMKEAFEAQINMFPLMSNKEIEEKIQKIRDIAYGWKISGAGGGGYLIVISDKKIPEGIKIKIRKK